MDVAPGDPARWAEERAGQLNRLRRYADAERAARDGLAPAPDHPGLPCELSVALGLQDRPDSALEAADAAIAAEPGGARGYLLRSQWLTQLRRHDEAVAAAATSLELAPHWSGSGFGYTRALHGAGRLPEARRAAARFVERFPHEPAGHIELGCVAHTQQDLGIARRAYTEALRLDPQDAVARHNLAILDLRAIRPGPALRGFLASGRLDPSSATLPHVAGVLLQVQALLMAWLAVPTVAGDLWNDFDPPPPDLSVTAGFWDPTVHASWSVRVLASAILLSGVGLARWRLGRVPRNARPVLVAALRASAMLQCGCGGLAMAIALYLALIVTGMSVFSAGVYLVLMVTVVLGGAVHLGKTVATARHQGK